MSQLNTLDLRDQLIQRVTDFALDDHFVADERLAEAMREIWSGPPEHGGLGSELWVEGAFPSRLSAETLQEAADLGLISDGLVRQLDRVGEFPSDRQPYTHQMESLEKAHLAKAAPDEQPALVVTAGTGAGKTESFLLPMLERLWSAPPSPGGGVSAIILYPMNALVNDQVGRLDKWLAGQSKISFFHFTSETPENAELADKWNVPPATAARFRTREQARGWEDRHGDKIKDGSGPQPQILVTNYSMLEYMLCRPQDAVFFGSNLRVIVLDEAHIYTGNLAAEITLLLRRVQMRCGRKPEQVLHIATSATMGGGAAELRPFAAKLFSKSESLVHLIVGVRTRPPLAVESPSGLLSKGVATALNQSPPPADDTLINRDGTPEFVSATEEAWTRWASLLPLLAPSDVVIEAMRNSPEKQVASMLAEVLNKSPAVAKLQELLWADEQTYRVPLPELAERLFGSSGEAEVRATRALLQMGATARATPDAWPLVPNRVHYLMRGPEGLLVLFRSGRVTSAYRQLDGVGHVFSAGADPASLGDEADHPLTLVRCTISGWWGVAARKVDGMLLPVPANIVLHGRNEDGEDIFDPETPDDTGMKRVLIFSLTEVEGATRYVFDPVTGRFSGDGTGVPLWQVSQCPRSGHVFSKNNIGWFSARARLQLSIFAETALAAMPEYPHPSKAWKPARGRRLLVFSDSRTEAARLGPRLTRQHELQVFRAAVVDSLERMTLGGDSADAQDLRNDCERVRSQLAAPSLSPIRRQSLSRHLEELEKELAGVTVGGTIDQWASVLKESAIISELVDPDFSETHDPNDDDHQSRWQRNDERVKKTLRELLGREMARRPTWPQSGLETLGLVEVVYPRLEELTLPAEIAGTVTLQIAERLQEAWTSFQAGLLDALRNQGCVTLGSRDSDDDYQFGGAFLGKYFSVRDAYKRSMVPLIGETFEGERVSRRNAYARDFLISAGMEPAEAIIRAPEVMRFVFEDWKDRAKSGDFAWLELRQDSPTHGDHVVPSLRLRFPLLGLRRPAHLYQCGETGQVWPRTVLGRYPGAARPTLSEISAAALDEDARIGRRQRELRDWTGFRQALWAEEHSAQLSPQENARLQNLFRIGMRNILSSTTTLELGIDIGGLSAVLMGNLPPGKANYLQRAGRAGRRADGSSAVLGFARPSSYEREVFLDFRRYLDRELRRPTVFLDRAAIVRRHAHAWLLGEFFQKHYQQGDRTDAMGAYGKMGPFTGAPLPQKWDKDDPAKPALPDPHANPVSSQFLGYLEKIATTAPERLLANLRQLWMHCPELEAKLQNGDAAWANIIQQIKSEFEKAIRDWREDVQSLAAAWQEVPATPPAGMSIPALRAQANAIFFQLRTLHQLTVIEALADSRVLPRYGFPIGLCRLHVQVADKDPHSGRMVLRDEDQFRLQRDSMMAMREYVPGSQLLAGGKIVTSRGLLKHWTGAAVANESWGLRGRFKRSSSGYFDYTITAQEPRPPSNPSPTDKVISGEMIFPKAGFCTSASEPPCHGSDFEKVGSVEVFTLAFNRVEECDSPQQEFGGIKGCTATYRHGGELLLLNGGENDRGFAICQKCGYAESEWHHADNKGAVNLPSKFDWHSPLQTTGKGKDRLCWADGTAPVWRRQHLAAKQTTHLLKLDFSRCGQPLTKELLVTLGQALRLAAAELLHQDVREIRALSPVPDAESGQYRFVILYDTLAGGAGHLAELSHPSFPERAAEWIRCAIDLLSVPDAFPESVREREALRRVLTADAADEVMVPIQAHDFLLKAIAAAEAVQPIAQASPSIPSDAWTLERLLMEEPPEHFTLYYPHQDVTGVAPGTSSCVRCTAKPAANTPVVLRHPGLEGGIGVGCWFARQLDEQDWQIRLRKSSGAAPALQISQEEYAALIPLAIITSLD